MGKADRKMLTRIRVALFFAMTWVLSSVTSELLGAQATASWFGSTIGPLLLPGATGLVVLAGIVMLVQWLWERPRHRPEEIEERRPRPITPPVWHPPLYPLFGRRNEVEQALERGARTGVVVLAGVRDIGTSAVAEHVTQRMVDEHGAEASHTYRFDLRSRSTSEPYDAAATAARIVTAFGVDEPSDDSDEVLSRAARRLLDVLPGQRAILFLDNVSTPEQVRWLVREWPSGDWPRLVIAGETAVGDAAEHRTIRVWELGPVHLREIWDWELDVPEPAMRDRIREMIIGVLGRAGEDLVGELLRACFGRPRAVKALAQEIRRLSGGAPADAEVLVRRMVAELRSEGPLEGSLERVWKPILDNIRDGLSERADWLLRALAELPVTGITQGGVAAVLHRDDEEPGGGNVLAPLEELRLRSLVQEEGGRVRLPREIRQPIVRTGEAGDRREVALRAVPNLVRFFTGYVSKWAGRLDVETERARAWFLTSEPSLRPLFEKDPDSNDPHRTDYRRDDELLGLVFADLCLIADGLDAWYVREQHSLGLLAVNQGLYELAVRIRREDIAALAAYRIAAAHRLAQRYGDATAWLDTGQSHTKSADDEVRFELEARERVERALLAASGPEPDPEAVGEAIAGLRGLLDAGKRLPGHAVWLVNLGLLAIRLKQAVMALECLREAEKVARDARDTGSEAHGIELQGVALVLRDQLGPAVRCWQRARTMFARLGDDLGEARCLQHLGAVALADARMAGLLRYGRPIPVARRDAAMVALPLLERSKELRSGQRDTALVDEYIDKAREELAD